MSAVSRKPEWHPLSGLRSANLVLAGCLALATILIRLPNFGDPTYHIDEAFYLLVGQQMHHGMIPYVHIWDRKPAGLFILYAGIAQFGTVASYQIFAGFLAWATAFVTALIATRFVGRVAAFAAGIVYLAVIGALAGGGGQSPVFYNLPVALAALLVLRRVSGEAGGTRADLSVMLLCGLALTVKPTAIAEGMFFGVALMTIHWLDSRDAWKTLRHGIALVAVALLPTVAIWLWFLAMGQFQTYWYATMVSVFQTASPAPQASAVRLKYLLQIIAPAAGVAAFGLGVLWSRARLGLYERKIAIFLSGWVAAALAGFLLVPNFYDHYALPLAAPMAVAGAALFDRARIGPVIAAILIAQLFAVSGFPRQQWDRNAQARSGFKATSELIAHHAGGSCILVYDATPALYRAGPPCGGSRFLFPEHLSNAREANAIGADPIRELTHVLARKPGVIVMAEQPSVSTPNWTTRDLLRTYVEQNYERVGQQVLTDVVGSQEVSVWRRRI
ncbi:ArnT family glycosyltransferase [Qipengyuania sp.]|uniref:ArnT family glycosyltransferase n=1 Tax=Qipengyuania sp. TaxID=2004515 RepID=UPI0035C81680